MPHIDGLTEDSRIYTTVRMPTVRLLADDLTGALDSAAELVPLAGTMPVFWPGTYPSTLPASAAIDSGTRESTSAQAIGVVTSLLGPLHSAEIAFKKIDSLLRGPTLAEVATAFASGLWESCVLAPAFPFQGRITRKGQQYSVSEGVVTAVGAPLTEALRHLGVPACLGAEGQPLRAGLNIFDAETDAALDAAVQTGLLHGKPVLWIGTGGLAQALARQQPKTTTAAPLPRPIFGLFGSDHPAMARQLAQCEACWIEMDHDKVDVMRLQLSHADPVLTSFRMPADTHRSVAATHIETAIERICSSLRPPGTVIVAGGETLRGVCTALGADYLEVVGALLPGVPRSIIRGGRWDGVAVVSKSGAFGPPDLLRQLPIFGELPS